MTNQELLILSFFDKDIPRQLTSQNLTSEMIEAGIISLGSSSYTYINLIHQLKTKDLLVRYIDPLKIQKGSSRAVGPELLVLSDKAVEILQRDTKERA